MCHPTGPARADALAGPMSSAQRDGHLDREHHIEILDPARRDTAAHPAGDLPACSHAAAGPAATTFAAANAARSAAAWDRCRATTAAPR